MKKLLWTATIAYMGMIFYLSSLTYIPPSAAMEEMFDIPALIQHAILYSGLGSLLFFSLRTRNHALMLAVSVAALYGVSDEFHQFFVPGRVCSVLDMVANGLGGAVGATVTGASVAATNGFRGRIMPLRYALSAKARIGTGRGRNRQNHSGTTGTVPSIMV